MSIENFNAENRNHILSPIPVRRGQCCSFCRKPGHNLSTCRSASINNGTYRDFEARCARKVINTNTRREFKNWLIENYFEQEEDLLIGFTFKKCRFTTMEPVDAITEYIFHTYKDENLNNHNHNPLSDDDYSEIPGHNIRMYLNDLERRRERGEFQGIEEIEEVRSMQTMLLRDMFVMLSSRYQTFLTQSNIINNNNNNDNKFDILLSIENNDEGNKFCENKNNNYECSICYDEKEITNFVKLGCNHNFCKDCIITTMKTNQTNNRKLCCALCRSEIKSIITRENSIHSEIAKFVS